ncbi:MAG: hypothetical protein IIY04_04370 [Oscillospiraceae bacterium]|nr:hypothetical protein [Oscillospiraceae bacterium]
MKKTIALLLAFVLVFALTACAAKTETAPEAGASAYTSSVEILNAIWAETPADAKFSAFGGNQNENAVMDAPGVYDITDTDGMSALLLIPSDVQTSIDDAASLIHFMNANTFTGAAFRVADGSAADAAAAMQNAILTNRYMCGFPEKTVVMTLDNYVLYAFGTEQFVNNFRDGAQTLTGELTVVCDEPIA